MNIIIVLIQYLILIEMSCELFNDILQVLSYQVCHCYLTQTILEVNSLIS